jgi:putative hydroxymethylpyrimidine transport system substrate-binding protein
LKRPAQIIALLFALLSLALAGCGERAEPTTPEKVKPDKINLMLDWQPNANHAGIYMGIADGAFTKRALVVDPKIPADGAGVVQQVEAGRVDLGLTYASYVLQAQDKGAKIKAIASVVNVPLNSLIWLKKSKIKDIKGLKGKTVAVSGDDNSSTLDTILQSHGVAASSVKQVNVGYKLQQILVAGRADASITGYWNVEGVELKEAGLKPTVLRVDKAGSPTYQELVVIANSDRLEDARRVETYRRFIAGLKEGTKDAVAHPAAAFAALAKKYPDLEKTAADRTFNTESLRVTLPVLAQRNIGANPFGWIDPSIWAAYGKWMHDNGELTTTGTTYTDSITNELLPGATPDDGGGSTEQVDDSDTGSVNSR